MGGQGGRRPRLAAPRENGFPPLGLQLLLGSQALPAQQNNLRNLEENRIALVQAALEKVR